MDPLKRYYQIVEKINANPANVSDEDFEFFLSYSPKLDNKSFDKLKDITSQSPADAARAIANATQQVTSSPAFKEKQLALAQKAEKGRLSQDIARGVDLVMAGSDIAQSIAQIQQSKQLTRASKRPARPIAPQRDQMLAQALRQSQVDTMDAGRQLAPIQANINDQYAQDINAAKTASTGQAGAFGAYAQLAANRRNRAALDLGAIQDQTRMQNQTRTDNLLGMRADETQRMFDNQSQFYPYDLAQYNKEQEAAASLGATGRSNLRNSIYGLGSQLPDTTAEYISRRKYADLRNRAAAAYGPEFADTAVNAQQYLEDQWKPRKGSAIADYWIEDPIAGSSKRTRQYPTI